MKIHSEHPLDQEFRQALEGMEMPFEPDDWLLMEQKLDKTAKPFSFIVNPKYVKFLAAAAIILSLTYGFKMMNLDLPSSNLSDELSKSSANDFAKIDAKDSKKIIATEITPTKKDQNILATSSAPINNSSDAVIDTKKDEFVKAKEPVNQKQHSVLTASEKPVLRKNTTARSTPVSNRIAVAPTTATTPNTALKQSVQTIAPVIKQTNALATATKQNTKQTITLEPAKQISEQVATPIIPSNKILANTNIPVALPKAVPPIVDQPVLQEAMPVTRTTTVVAALNSQTAKPIGTKVAAQNQPAQTERATINGLDLLMEEAVAIEANPALYSIEQLTATTVEMIPTIEPVLVLEEKTVAAIPAPEVPKEKQREITSVGVHSSADLNFSNIGDGTHLNNTTGISLAWTVPNKKWTIETGAYYTKKTFVSDGYSPNKSNNNTVITFDQNNIYRDVELNFTAVEVPILVKRNFNVAKKLQPYVATGVSAYVPVKEQIVQNLANSDESVLETTQEYTLDRLALINNTGYEITADNSTNQLRATNQRNPAKPYFDIVNVQTGLSYQLTKQLSLTAEAQFKTSLTKHELNRSIQTKFLSNKGRLNSFGLQFGVVYSL